MIARQLGFSILGVVISPWLAVSVFAAQPIQATARAARTTAHVGEPVRLTIQVQNSEELPQIDVPSAEGVNISSTGTAEATPSALRNARSPVNRNLPNSKLLASLRDLSKQLKDASGGVPNGGDPQLSKQYQAMLQQQLGNLNRNDYTIVYLATPEKTGPLTVPPFTVHSGGQTLKTRPINLSVTEARTSPWVRAALSLSNAEPSVGDTVNLYVDLLVRRWTQQVGRGNVHLNSQPINHVTLTVPTLEGYKEIQPLESLEQFIEKRRLPPDERGYHINHFPGVILLEQEPTSGAAKSLDPQWYRRRLTIPFHAVRAGEMEVPPLRVAGEVYVPTTGKERYDWEGFAASSPPLKFRIREGLNPPTALAPKPSPMMAKAPVVEQPSASAVPPSSGEPGNEGSARSWLLLLGTVAVSFVMVRVILVLRRLLAVRRQRIALVSRHKQAIDKARQRLQTPPWTAADVSAAVQSFLRAQLEMEPGEITPEEAAERLTQTGHPAELAQKCAEVLHACATRQFAPLGTVDIENDSDLASAAERLVQEILSVKRIDSSNPPVPVDELTRERQTALAD
ncbi:MAG TPA: BatD family protein [Gemmataceae bacterium]|jgi:hypothetical protein